MFKKLLVKRIEKYIASKNADYESVGPCSSIVADIQDGKVVVYNDYGKVQVKNFKQAKEAVDNIVDAWEK